MVCWRMRGAHDAGRRLLRGPPCYRRLRGRATEVDADGLHVVMGVAMAGMFEPRLNPLPALVSPAVFAAGAWVALAGGPRRGPGLASRYADARTPAVAY